MKPTIQKENCSIFSIKVHSYFLCLLKFYIAILSSPHSQIVSNCIILLNTASASYIPWTLGHPEMPRGLYGHALAYDDYNNRIWIIGGVNASKQLMSFDINTFSFNDHGKQKMNNLILHGIYQPNTASYYSQLNNIVYMVDVVGDIYTMMTETGSIQLNTINAPYEGYYQYIPAIGQSFWVNWWRDSCLSAFTMKHDYLFVAGGATYFSPPYNETNGAFIFDITDNNWLNVPTMPYKLIGHSCSVVDQVIYVIGGYNQFNAYDIIQTLDITELTNIENQTWKKMNQTLFSVRVRHNAIVYGTNIVVIGGMDDPNLPWYSHYIPSLDIIHTITNTVSYVGTLNFNIDTGASIIAQPRQLYASNSQPRIYEFSGWYNERLRTWQYHTLTENINNYMSPINIYPVITNKVSSTINIRSNIELTDNNISYYAKFNILKDICFNASLTIFYQDTDFLGTGKFLHIYYNNSLIANCGSNNNICGDYKYCLKDYNFPILSQQQFVIHIEKGTNSAIPTNCNYSLWADITLQCDTIPTFDPTDSPTLEPTLEPTIYPTLQPTLHPTFPTLEPTIYPTLEPTLHPTFPTIKPSISPSTVPSNSPSKLTIAFVTPSRTETWVFVLIGIIVLIIVVSLLIFVVYRKNKIDGIFIKNPMVILLAIGDYDNEPQDSDINGLLQDLNVDTDIRNLLTLFKDKLNYQTFPIYNEPIIRLHWTQDELMELLEKQSEIFSDNLEGDSKNKFDSLIVAISCHGITANILTSDYKTIDKNVIHRIFSSYHPAAREVPRIIIYDCCDGDEEVRAMEENEIGKHYGIERINVSDTPLWARYTENPDCKLVTIHASNMGFQSKMNHNGSYLITKFVQKTIDGLKRKENNQPFLHNIFDEIQDELGKNKQLPICTYNNNTRYIKFIERKSSECIIEETYRGSVANEQNVKLAIELMSMEHKNGTNDSNTQQDTEPKVKHYLQ
eukprot:1431_1